MDDDQKVTQEEIEIIELLGRAMNGFASLKELHPADQQEFAYAIHLAQNIVLARSGMKQCAASRSSVHPGDQNRA